MTTAQHLYNQYLVGDISIDEIREISINKMSLISEDGDVVALEYGFKDNSFLINCDDTLLTDFEWDNVEPPEHNNILQFPNKL